MRLSQIDRPARIEIQNDRGTWHTVYVADPLLAAHLRKRRRAGAQEKVAAVETRDLLGTRHPVALADFVISRTCSGSTPSHSLTIWAKLV
jgi:hypothetical protein